jgi:glycosyltransferase involved in cell wall biosynthesis
MFLEQVVILCNVFVIEVGDSEIEQDVEQEREIEKHVILTVRRVARLVLHGGINLQYPERFDKKIQGNKDNQVGNKLLMMHKGCEYTKLPLLKDMPTFERSLKIVVNTRLLLPGRLDGIGWFSYQSLRRITVRHPEVHFIFLFDRPYSDEFIFSDNVTPIIISPPARHPFLFYYWMQFSVKPLLKRLEPDMFLSPDGFLSLGASCKQLPVIHDLNFAHHPKDLPFWVRWYYNRFFPRFAKAATRIATVSEFSKKDIATTYGIDPSKIDVVYNGINDHFHLLDDETKHVVKNKWTKGCDYFLFVGSVSKRKNIARLVKAFHAFKNETSAPLKLVLAGAIFWGMDELNALITELNLSNEVVFTGRISNEEIKDLMGSAFALTYLPYFEGFGIPLVEAMQAGIPILAADATCLPEIAANAAVYADPFDEHAISNCMKSLYSDAALRSRLVQSGLERKNLFSWDRTADLLWESIEKTLSQKG